MNHPDLQDSAFEIVSNPFIFQSPDRWHWTVSHPGHWNLWICLEGLAEIECDGVLYEVRPWTGFLFPDDAVIRGRSREGTGNMRNFSVHFMLGAANAQLLNRVLLGLEFDEVESVNVLIELAIRLSAFSDSFAAHQLNSLVMDLVGLLWRVSKLPIQNDVASIIYRQLDRFHAGHDLFRSVDELAAEANLSRMHYSRLFRGLTGNAPNRYLIAKRIERACVLLAQTEWPIEAVGRSVGYGDPYFFSKQFQENMNRSPSTYRRACKSGQLRNQRTPDRGTSA